MQRRDFLRGAASAVALGLVGCDSCGRDGRRMDPSPSPSHADDPEPRLEFFGATEADTARALFSALIPDDDPPGSPGATTARVVVYVDRTLREPSFRRFHRFVRDGLADLERLMVRDHRVQFAHAPLAPRQVMLKKFQLGQVQGARVPAATFFNVMHGLALEGFWGAPSHGGNHDMVAWKWAGIEVTCH